MMRLIHYSGLRLSLAQMLALAWVGAFTVSVGACLLVQEGQDVKNIAVIGAGAAGSSAAYHLQRYAQEEQLPLNVTVFEKTNHIGGRTLTVDAYSDPSEPVELGASIFVEVNKILYNATKTFNLPLAALREGEPGDVTAIWNGDEFVYQTTDGEGWWWDVGRLWWRYGMSPYWAVKLVKKVVGKFLKAYEEPWFPFRSLTRVLYDLDLVRITGLTGEQFLEENKINPDFARDIIQAATRVNYASNLAYIHGVEAMVSFATEGAVSVAGGNWKIFDNMVKDSGAALYRNTTVTSITEAPAKSDESPPKYLIGTKDSASDASTEAEDFPIAFDNVVIASPWQFSDIKADESVLPHIIEEVPYTKMHVTLFTSPYSLRPGFFGLEPGAKAPRNVYTTLSKDEEPHQGADGVGKTGFYSISTLRTVTNPKTQRREFLYKIFSPDAVTPSFLTNILGADVPEEFVAEASTISWYYPTWFHSYPIELPRVTFEDPVVGNGVYYTSGIESFISTMETSALMGMNVARLIADDFADVQRVDVNGMTFEEQQQKFMADAEL